MEKIRIKILTTLSKTIAASGRKVMRGIFENSPIPNEEPKNLYVEVAAKDGKLIGVLYGNTVVGWFNIWGLWVDKPHRGKGLGASMVKAAETEARRRKCKKSFVQSLDFQAPGFYRKQGYLKFGAVKNAIKEHTLHYFQKDL